MEKKFDLEGWLAQAPEPVRRAFADVKAKQELFSEARGLAEHAKRVLSDAQATEDHAERDYDQSVATLLRAINECDHYVEAT